MKHAALKKVGDLLNETRDGLFGLQKCVDEHHQHAVDVDTRV